MQKEVKVMISWSGDNYCASAELDGLVIVTARTVEKLKEDFLEAFRFHIEDDDSMDNYTFNYELQVSAILHQLDGILTRASLSRVTGINQKQLGHYINGFKTPREPKKKQIIAGIRDIGEKILSVV